MKIKIAIICILLILAEPHYLLGQVNLQTGAAQISIPLYSYSNFANRLSANITLAYIDGNGLKVAEVGSPVGTGWSLNCGGLIERIQYGERDDQKNNDTYSYPNYLDQSNAAAYSQWAQNYYPNGYLYSEFPSADPVTNGAAATPLTSNQCTNWRFIARQKYITDREQDVFSFNFNGRYGLFIIGKPGQNGQSEIRTLTDSKLKIQRVDGDLNNNSDIRTSISEFQITDEDGIKYVFKDANISEICEYTKSYLFDNYGNRYLAGGNQVVDNCPKTMCLVNCDPYGLNIPNLYALKAVPKNKFVKDQWYLSEIINPSTGVEILFQYETYSFDYDGEIITNAVASSNTVKNMTLLIARHKGIAKRLKTIILSPFEKVEFSYSSSQRVDFNNDKFLDHITIIYNNEIKYSWNFNYGYVVKNSIRGISENFTNEDKRWARLYLLDITRKGAGFTSDNPYRFSYYMGNEGNMNSAVPPIFTFLHNSFDYYNATAVGFYNPSTHTISTSNQPYEPYDGNLFSKDFYSSLTISRSLYDYRFTPSLEARNGIIKSVTYPYGGSLTFEYQANLYGPNGYGGSVSVNKSTSYDGIDHTKDIVNEYNYTLENGTSSAWGFEPFKYTYDDHTDVFPGGSNSNQINPGPLVIEFAMKIQSELNYVPPEPNLTQLNYLMENNLLGAGGFNNFTIVQNYVINTVLQALLTWMASSGSPNQHLDNVNYSSVPFNTQNLLPYQFARVEVISRNGIENIGKNIYEFTSPADYPIDVPVFDVPFSAKQRYAYWQYGLLKKQTVKNKYDLPVKIVENIYSTPIKYTISDPNFLSQKWLPKNKILNTAFIRFDSPIGPPVWPYDDNTSTDLYSQFYSPVCGRMELATSKEYTYNNNNEYIVTTTNYSYSPNNYLPNKITTTNSKGELIETNTYYAQDYSLTGIIQSMKDRNILNAPISTQKLITKNGNQKYLINGSLTEFGAVSNGDIKPIRTYSFRSDNPVISTSVPFSSSQLIPNTTYYQETGSIAYNSNGLPIQVNTESGKTSTIYGYDNRLIGASVTNAASNEIFFESFEEPGTWNSLTALDNTKTHTGKYSARIDNPGPGEYFCHSTKWLTISLTAATKFKYSGWIYTTGPSAEIFLFMKTATEQSYFTYVSSIVAYETNKWVYVEGEYIVPANITQLNIRIDNNSTGTVWYDDIRLHPSAALMNTYTYDPLIGKTSECDANGRIIYYDYDDLGRLQFIRDENRNIIKMYEYNYKH